MTTEAFTTELGAVNTLLSTIGEHPVNSLSSGSLVIADVRIALETLRETSRAFQVEGWHFNTEKEFEIARNSADEIVLSTDMMEVDPSPRCWQGDIEVVKRGGRLYDKKNHTFTFERDLKCDIIFLIQWDDLPEAARRYITIKAARIFQARTVGDNSLNGFTEREEVQARVAFKKSESRTADRTFLDHPEWRPIIVRSGW